MPARVAITGGSGFVGSYVTEMLERHGYNPIMLGPMSSPAAARSAYWDLESSVNEMTKAIEGVSVLIHLAAYIPADLNDQKEISKCLLLNAIGTANLLKAASDSGVRQFIYASTAALYTPQKERCSENHPLFPRRAVPYLSSKLAAEVYVHNAAGNSRMICTILRLASVYGPGMRGDSLVPVCVKELISSGSFTVSDGNRYRTDLVYAGDVARAFISCIGRKSSEVFNIGSGTLISPQEIARCTSDLLKLDSRCVNIEPPKNGPAPTGSNWLDISSARRELQFAPTGLREGLGKYIDSLR